MVAQMPPVARPQVAMPQVGEAMSATLAGRSTITKAWERLGKSAQNLSAIQFRAKTKMPSLPMPGRTPENALNIVRGGGICTSDQGTALDQSTMRPLACQVTPGPDPRRRWQQV